MPEGLQLDEHQACNWYMGSPLTLISIRSSNPAFALSSDACCLVEGVVLLVSNCCLETTLLFHFAQLSTEATEIFS